MESLPNELLFQIFDLIEPQVLSFSSPPDHQRTRAFAQLCLVGRKFNRLATPLLYQEIERIDHEDISIQKLLETLRRSPALRQHIKSIRYKIPRESVNIYHRRRSYGMFKDSPERLLTTSICHDLGISVNRGVDAHRVFGDDIFLASAILQAPKIEQFWYAIHQQGSDIPLVVEGISRSAFGVPFESAHAFEQLRVLTIDFSQSFYTPISAALPFLLLPWLEDLTLSGWTGDNNYEDLGSEDTECCIWGKRWQWPLRASTIKILTLFRPSFFGDVVAKIIQSCRALEKLHLRGTECRSSLYYGAISQAILEQAESLEELTIGNPATGYNRGENYGRLDCLSQLLRLKHLRIPFYLLINRAQRTPIEEALPPNVKSVVADFPFMPHQPERYDHYFARLPEACSSGLVRCLKTIQLRWVCWNFRPEVPIDFVTLRSLLGPHEVQLDVVLLCEDYRAPPEKTINAFAEVFPFVQQKDDYVTRSNTVSFLVGSTSGELAMKTAPESDEDLYYV